MPNRPSILMAVTLIAGAIGCWFFWPFGREAFLETASPDGTYLVELQGQPKRPFWFTVEVGSVVSKAGNVFWPYQNLHSGDAMDISFELGWPDHRWLQENILQLYSREELISSRRQQIILMNDLDETVPQVLLSCNDKFLIFDLTAKAVVPLSCGPPKGDSQGVHVLIEQTNGMNVEGSSIFPVNAQFSR